MACRGHEEVTFLLREGALELSVEELPLPSWDTVRDEWLGRSELRGSLLPWPRKRDQAWTGEKGMEALSPADDPSSSSSLAGRHKADQPGKEGRFRSPPWVSFLSPFSLLPSPFPSCIIECPLTTPFPHLKPVRLHWLSGPAWWLWQV